MSSIYLCYQAILIVKAALLLLSASYHRWSCFDDKSKKTSTNPWNINRTNVISFVIQILLWIMSSTIFWGWLKALQLIKHWRLYSSNDSDGEDDMHLDIVQWKDSDLRRFQSLQGEFQCYQKSFQYLLRNFDLQCLLFLQLFKVFLAKKKKYKWSRVQSL